MTNTHFTMPKVQILVADSARARFFTVDSPTAELVELETYANPEARLREEALMDDRPGRRFDPGPSRSAVEDRTDPKDVTIRRFARELAQKLDQDRNQGKLERLYLVAGPPFLGVLRKHLDNQVKPLIAEEIPKDLAHLEPRKLRKHLPELLK